MSPGELAAARFKILRDNTYDSIEYYADMKDLIFVLRNTPIIPGFDIDKDHRFLEEIDDKYKTQFGIKTNSARYQPIQTPPTTNQPTLAPTPHILGGKDCPHQEHTPRSWTYGVISVDDGGALVVGANIQVQEW